MSNIIVKLRGMIQQNFKLCVLMLLLGHQHGMIAMHRDVKQTVDSSRMADGNSNGLGKRPFHEISDAAKIENAPNKIARMQVGKKVTADLNEKQTTEIDMNDETARVSAVKTVGNKETEEQQTDQQVAEKKAIGIAENLVNALKSVSSAIGLTYACSSIAAPIRSAWVVQARKLQIDEQGNVQRDFGSGPLRFNDLPSEDRGALNQRIDNIVNSIMRMYNEKTISFNQIGTFVKNSVELLLITPVVGMGAGAGAMIGGASGVAYGALEGLSWVVPKNSMYIMIPSGDAGVIIIAIIAAPIVVATAIGGVRGGLIGTYKGARAGADYTSRFIKSPTKAANDVMKYASDAVGYTSSTSAVNSTI